MGERAQRGRRGGDCGRDAHADETDRPTARRDPVLGARLLEGTTCGSGCQVGLRGSGSVHGAGRSTVQRRVERSRGHLARGRRKEGGRRALTGGAVVSVGVRAMRLREQAGARGELGRASWADAW